MSIDKLDYEFYKFINDDCVRETWGHISEFNMSNYHFSKFEDKIYIKARIFHDVKNICSIEIFDLVDNAFRLFKIFYTDNIKRIIKAD